MNSSKITVLVVAFIMTAVAAFADAPVSLSVVPASNAYVYTVYYKTAESGKVKISIVNANDKLVFSEVLNNVASFSRPYNFSQLEEGQYTIILEDKNGRQVEKVNYTMNKINSIVKVTRLQNDADKFVLSVVNNGSENVMVRIYSADNTILHEQRVNVTGNFALMYNLSQAKIGVNQPVTFEVTTSDKTEVVTF